jgi:hypothetical protein
MAMPHRRSDASCCTAFSTLDCRRDFRWGLGRSNIDVFGFCIEKQGKLPLDDLYDI